MNPELERELQGFVDEKGFKGKGKLSVAVVVTQHAKDRGLPLEPEALITEGGGQVLGLGVVAGRFKLLSYTSPRRRPNPCKGGREDEPREHRQHAKLRRTALTGCTPTACWRRATSRRLNTFGWSVSKTFLRVSPSSFGSRPVGGYAPPSRICSSRRERAKAESSGMMVVGPVMQHPRRRETVARPAGRDHCAQQLFHKRSAVGPGRRLRHSRRGPTRDGHAPRTRSSTAAGRTLRRGGGPSSSREGTASSPPPSLAAGQGLGEAVDVFDVRAVYRP